MNELLSILMNRDGMKKCEVIAEIKELHKIHSGDMEEILYDLGLEPDYCYDLYEILTRIK